MTDPYGDRPGIRLDCGNIVILASKERGCHLLSTKDDFTISMGPFDRMLRMKASSPPSPDELCRFVGGCTLEWEPPEADKIVKTLETIGPMISEYGKWLPHTILLIKTTGDEEFKSAYTRANAIILPMSKLDYSGDKMGLLLIHELFHMITRFNPGLRERLYAMIGFHPCGRVGLPAPIKDRALANLDSPQTDYFIRIRFDGEPFTAIPVIFLKKDIREIGHGEDILEYIAMRLMAVEERPDGWRALCHDGEPVLIEAGQASGFYEQIGRNTEYTIGPDEVLAENFVLLATGQKRSARTPEIIERMECLLKG